MTTYPIPNPKTWVDGEVVTATDLNAELRDAIAFLINKPAFKAAPDDMDSLVDGIYNRVTFTHIFIDNTSMFNATTPDQIQVTYPGVYDVYAQCRFNAGTDGARYIHILKNGTEMAFGEFGSNPGGQNVVNCSSFLYLTPDDILAFEVKETGSGSQALGVNDFSTFMQLKWVSRDM